MTDQKRIRLTKEQRCRVIVTAAVKIANDEGLTKVTHDSVAAACTIDTTRWTVKHWFTSKTDLFIAIINHPDANESVLSAGRNIGITRE